MLDLQSVSTGISALSLHITHILTHTVIAIPTYCRMTDLPATDAGILKNLLAAVSKVAASRFLSADGIMTHIILDAIIEKDRYASQEYFGRAWTLAGQWTYPVLSYDSCLILDLLS